MSDSLKSWNYLTCTPGHRAKMHPQVCVTLNPKYQWPLAYPQIWRTRKPVWAVVWHLGLVCPFTGLRNFYCYSYALQCMCLALLSLCVPLTSMQRKYTCHGRGIALVDQSNRTGAFRSLLLIKHAGKRRRQTSWRAGFLSTLLTEEYRAHKSITWDLLLYVSFSVNWNDLSHIGEHQRKAHKNN